MAKASEHFFYVLKCSDNSYYGGYTTDVIRREAEHNAGIRCKYTKTRRPVKVIHFEKFETRSEATKAEAAFKKLSRKNKDAYLIQREEESE
ncbi:GIY-YIG nuclease family protein [Listeria monocytogenes]|uniref:GIY-YIG nuclease family protein n=1 Tax=Listeria monocytogenes TaxID=1639 RepID=UPI0011EAF620|nr:GIY-YIG nuclease family protein [Listeria monocytogenes]EAF5858351.1 GIY-YIG nuclease family protein [Listeria monocytogenes]EAG5450306.1 GIY-YIG nuclease family protein [Listeria monocytogenes]EDN9972823.1 GIY-YIG nuclease family protein [Listeria monocytogenes]EFO7247900.1 GIY-YIG nuclease family protein [Listeria monocytogenes]EHR3673585.1 GIY-YIG nuclease family protein [Listeria monocytogenes]